MNVCSVLLSFIRSLQRLQISKVLPVDQNAQVLFVLRGKSHLATILEQVLVSDNCSNRHASRSFTIPRNCQNRVFCRLNSRSFLFNFYGFLISIKKTENIKTKQS